MRVKNEIFTESVKVTDFTNNDVKNKTCKFGNYKLPSGNFGKLATCGTIELYLLGNPLTLTCKVVVVENSSFEANVVCVKLINSEADALKVFNNIAKDLTDTTSAIKISRKYGLRKQ